MGKTWLKHHALFIAVFLELWRVDSEDGGVHLNEFGCDFCHMAGIEPV